jgi:hypothetical protein
VLLVGCTTVEPVSTGVTFPTPLSIDTAVAFWVCQVRVTASPGLIVVLSAVSDRHIGWPGPGGGGVVFITTEV